MRFYGGSLAGAGYIILNVIRVLNIISLLAVQTASGVMLVKTFIVSKFFFFDAAAHVIAMVICGMFSPDRATLTWLMRHRFSHSYRITAFQGLFCTKLAAF